MAGNSGLIKNTFLISFTQISAQIVNFLLLPVYTAVLSTAEYGRVDLYATLRSVLICVLFLGIEQSLFQFCVSEKNTRRKKEYFSAGLMVAVCLLIIFSILFLTGGIIGRFQYAKMLYLYYFSYGIFCLLLYIARGFEKTEIYAVANTLGTVFTAGFNIIFVVWLRLGVRGVLLGSIVAYTLVIIYMLIRLPLFSMITLRWRKGIVKEMLGYSMPLVLNNVMGWVTTSSDRLIIVAILGNSMNGIYSLANKFYTILMVLSNGFTMAWAETAIKLVQQPNHKAYYQKIICLFMDLCVMVISGMVTVLPPLFEHFFSEEYKSAYYHIPIIIYAAFWYAASGVIAYILLAHKKSRIVGIGTFLVAVINLVIHFSLIGRIGLFAASISTLVSYIGLFVFRYFFMYQCEKISFPWARVLVQLCIFLILCGCYYRKGTICLLVEVCIYLVCVMVFIKTYWIEIVDLLEGIREKKKNSSFLK